MGGTLSFRSAICGVALFAVNTISAQTVTAEEHSPSPAQISTNIADIKAFKSLPPQLDASKASKEQLALYGLPEKPDQAKAPQEYEIWKLLVEAAHYRIIPKIKAPGDTIWFDSPYDYHHP